MDPPWLFAASASRELALLRARSWVLDSAIPRVASVNERASPVPLISRPAAPRLLQAVLAKARRGGGPAELSHGAKRRVYARTSRHTARRNACPSRLHSTMPPVVIIVAGETRAP